MTPKQKLFVAEYLTNGLNATKAAIAAGYSKKTARSVGAENLTKSDIVAAVAKQTKEPFERLEITADKVLEEIARTAFANMLDYITIGKDGKITEFDYAKLTREQAAAIQGITMDTTGGSGDGERRLVLRTRLSSAISAAARNCSASISSCSRIKRS